MKQHGDIRRAWHRGYSIGVGARLGLEVLRRAGDQVADRALDPVDLRVPELDAAVSLAPRRTP